MACKLELFKKPIIYFINQDISAERENSSPEAYLVKMV
jgi:hypothetical protein